MKNVLFLTTLIAVSLIDLVATASFFPASLPVPQQAINPTLPRFAGGNQAQKGAFPWIISIQYKQGKGWKHDCGGAIMDAKHILTAGHCVWNRNASEIELVAGIHEISVEESTQQRRKPDKIFLHPNYTSGDAPGAFDIAIIRLKRSFTYTKNIKRIELAKCNEAPKRGDKCSYAGWGNLFPVSPFYYQGSKVLLTESTSIITLEECKDAYAMHPEALATAICSRSGAFHGTCQGDSGGPLSCPRPKKLPYLAGVVSFGFPVCNDGYHPDVYTNLGNPHICEFISNYESMAEQSRIVWTSKS